MDPLPLRNRQKIDQRTGPLEAASIHQKTVKDTNRVAILVRLGGAIR